MTSIKSPLHVSQATQCNPNNDTSVYAHHKNVLFNSKKKLYKMNLLSWHLRPASSRCPLQKS